MRRMNVSLNKKDKFSKYAWKVLSDVLYYILCIADEISLDIVSIDEVMKNGFGWQLGPFEIIFVLVAWVPYLSVTFRRLHDVNRSGWWFLIPLTIIGIIPFAYWLLKQSDTNSNKYGPKPVK